MIPRFCFYDFFVSMIHLNMHVFAPKLCVHLQFSVMTDCRGGDVLAPCSALHLLGVIPLPWKTVAAFPRMCSICITANVEH